METQKNTQETLLAREKENFSTNSKHGILQEALNREALLASEKEKGSTNSNYGIPQEATNQLTELNRHKIPAMLGLGILHTLGAIGLVLIFRGQVPLSTIIFVQLLSEVAVFGVATGAHQYWSHRTFKARTPLKLLLATCFSFSGQESIWVWSAWHRAHHKFVNTDLDPHNSNRGFFYSHIGWLILYDHEAFKKEVLPKIDMSDLENEPIVMIQDKYYPFIQWICNLIIPTLIPWYLFGDTFLNSLCVGAGLRYIYALHRVMLVNSASHKWGWRTYDTSINPAHSQIVALFLLGDGSHDYHHVFPRDYKGADTGILRWNLNAAFINFFAWIGWAYDLKSVPKDVVAQRVKRTGNHHHLRSGPWGWDNANIPNENSLHEFSYPSKEF